MLCDGVDVVEGLPSRTLHYPVHPLRVHHIRCLTLFLFRIHLWLLRRMVKGLVICIRNLVFSFHFFDHRCVNFSLPFTCSYNPNDDSTLTQPTEPKSSNNTITLASPPAFLSLSSRRQYRLSKPLPPLPAQTSCTHSTSTRTRVKNDSGSGGTGGERTSKPDAADLPDSTNKPHSNRTADTLSGEGYTHCPDPGPSGNRRAGVSDSAAGWDEGCYPHTPSSELASNPRATLIDWQNLPVNWAFVDLVMVTGSRARDRRGIRGRRM
jgi:hypothetical protein